MKRNFTKAVGAGVLTLSMGIMPLTLSAQAQTTTDPGVNTAPRTTTYERNDFDWGWLGLIGLLGLAGLAGRKRDDEPTRYRDPNTPGATTYRD
ncbi:WGxxGxxG family protein [Nostoc sp. MG11]|uniref:WGxxGxxG family protein n=1 Tax=Nostoc sp. MG11 TaxID=2721166 RepID=UPI001865B801|nr:WGxxGxxG family protein [Nostoc sp. MG11]